ncbi:hypothetical protein FGIG_03375 [Fasciola gigantica]|uniref:Uncharacterized protein n=1 Tax=Fasciola gigantica TaxID=46835 RepID=A0A504YX64_FASGI|nr:hypothetical protein FGIG_03375 [Fasciola gigantica]
MRAVTYIDSNREFKTYQFKLLSKGGITQELVNRLNYAIIMIDTLLSPSQNSCPSKKSAPPDSKSAVAPVSSAVRQATAAGSAAAAKAIARLTKPEN